jgi:hypothetical protein
MAGDAGERGQRKTYCHADQYLFATLEIPALKVIDYLGELVALFLF